MDIKVVGWLCTVIMTAIVVTVPAACTVHRDNLKAEVIREGADPAAASCAFRLLCLEGKEDK